MKNSYITVTDQFCGAGGSSIGATNAGAVVRMAMNHWQLAVDTHNTNFPNVTHDVADISAVNPRRYPSTNILITSPECTNHSLAKGKKRQSYQEDLFGNVLLDPAEERSRATMWDVPRFAEYHNYEIIVVENVVDAGKWILWESWLHSMSALGYDHEVVYFNSMFAWPTPQSRDRMYTVFWKRGNRKPDLEFRPPAFCQRCQSNIQAIQTWKKRKKWGRYGAAKGYGQYYYRCPSCSQEVRPYYFAAFNAIDWSIEAERIGDRAEPLRPKTMERIQYGFDMYGRKPMIVTGRYTSGVECRVRDASQQALPTQPGDSSHAVVYPWLVETSYTKSSGSRVHSAIDPQQTQTSRQSMGIVGFLSKQYGGAADPQHMAVGLDRPTGTITTWDHHAMIGVPAPFLVKTTRMDSNQARNSIESLWTQTTCQDVGLVAPAFMAELHGTSTAGGLDDPLMCVMAGGNHHALLSTEAFLSYYYGSNQASGINEAVRTMTSVSHAALVGALDAMTIEDLTFRMLQPHEIGKAMAFPSDYVVLGTKRQQVRQYGNAVTPPVMDMILKRCIETLQ